MLYLARKVEVEKTSQNRAGEVRTTGGRREPGKSLEGPFKAARGRWWRPWSENEGESPTDSTGGKVHVQTNPNPIEMTAAAYTSSSFG